MDYVEVALLSIVNAHNFAVKCVNSVNENNGRVHFTHVFKCMLETEREHNVTLNGQFSIRFVFQKYFCLKPTVFQNRK
jgi:hypothetical protein